MKVFALVLASLAVASAFVAPHTAVKAPQTVVKATKTPTVPVAAALPALALAAPAHAALPSVAGIPGGLLLTFFPIVIAASVAILIIGPGALQQLERVFSGQSSKYMKGDY
mmetsp:Transcript_21161/g.65320  ORF Transcript_21161/g.65320 Transcript_21161/m.65320 type:complete len:111 (+) Transcript_21161:69-401(+)|eukprot:CAMPEP_0198643728 /NCGR_PEP_ID=MMETSP1467-20131203/8_1 /TAXON_ID=1462469 /ORGANISM="unid. sp., Strain CCMP2135" /LENGTH=110 /DNA_ID=CAMNT_0044379131 /DNA_START=43 /DNA_END=375 /DNA_ORIENTATION=-